ncbi:MAG TPA: energy transducer TonB [Hyphomonadaceae bacterium]|jgi:outer membrane biosynthesis protein TonB
MKLIHAILGVGAASLLPTALAPLALAQEPAAKPFLITVASDAKPVSHAEYRYPSYAGARDLEGACEVSFAISTAGKADAIRVGACTSEAFRRAAKSTVEGMTFAPSAAVTTANATIRWRMPDPQVRTASLD